MSSLYTVAITPVLNGLKNTAAVLQKGLNHAKENNIDPNTFATASLHPDMFNLIRQIQTATDMAKFMPYRLNPSIEPLSLPDTETTIPELIVRIKKVIDYLEAIKPEDVNGKEEAVVKFSVGPPGKQWPLEFVGLQYVQTFAHPNFWFHVTTAYDILRKEGVDVGKNDFLNGAKLIKVEW